MITVGQAAEWIIENRRGKSFQGYDFNKIVCELNECLDENSFLCVTDNNQIYGIVCAKKDTKRHVFYIWDILTTKKGTIKRMVEYFLAAFPGYTLEGKIGERKRIFTDIEKLKRRL